jgi:hypothetical protein
VAPATSEGPTRRLPLHVGPARRSYPSTTRTPTPSPATTRTPTLSGFYSDSSYEFDFGSDPDEPESDSNTTEQPLSGPTSGLVITYTPTGRFVYWPDRKHADLTGGNSRYFAYLDSLPFHEGTPLAPAGEHTPTEVATSDSSLGSPDRQVFMTTNETPGPQGQSLTNISRTSQRTSCPPTRPPTRPTPTGTLDVNATESGTNGANVSASPFPSETSQKHSTKSRAGCTPPREMPHVYHYDST